MIEPSELKPGTLLRCTNTVPCFSTPPRPRGIVFDEFVFFLGQRKMGGWEVLSSLGVVGLFFSDLQDFFEELR